MKTIVAITPEPPDASPDLGPNHRGGPFALFIAIFCAFSFAGTVLLLWREHYRLWAGLGALFFGGAALRAAWCIIERFRHHAALPRSHAVLTGALAFDIHSTCRDVAATVFFDPDGVQPGALTRLYCFVENYASRWRRARFRIGPHPGLGLNEEHCISLALAAGQAAVYALPLGVAATLGAGEHDLPVTLQVDKPNGTGARLPGSRRHLYDLWTVHFAVPFTVDAALADKPTPAGVTVGKGRCLSLASVSEPEPRLDALHTLVAGNPDQTPASA
jgi:hypothetical protein